MTDAERAEGLKAQIAGALRYLEGRSETGPVREVMAMLREALK